MKTIKLMQEQTFVENMAIVALTFQLDLANSQNDIAYAKLLKTILKNYPDELVKNAFLAVLKTCKFLPKIADFMGFLELAPRTEAKLAWGKVLGLLSRYGGLRNQKVLVDGATAEAIRQLGGWYSLALKPSRELSFLATNFETLYEEAFNSGLKGTTEALQGIRDKNPRTGEYIALEMIVDSFNGKVEPQPTPQKALCENNFLSPSCNAKNKITENYTENYVDFNYNFKKLAEAKKMKL